MSRKTTDFFNALFGIKSNPATPPPPPSPPTPPTIRGSKTVSDTFDNPVNDSTLATVLTQVRTDSIATVEAFTEQRGFRIFVPKKLETDFVNAPAGSKPKARVSLFFGVGPEMSIFRLKNFFADEPNSVLITVPGVEHDDPVNWPGIKIPFGYGISTAIINNLMTQADLDGIDFTIEVMAGYSTGYRGVNLTIINELVDLTHLTRVIYLDAWYHHDDHPLMPSGSQYFKKLTHFAIDTALSKSPSAKIVVYALTPGGVPRTNPSQTNQSIPNPPTEPLVPAASINFIDFNFKFNSKPAVIDAVTKICLARLIQLGIGNQITEADVTAASPALLTLVQALPVRGSLGVLGLAGYTDLYGWITSHSAEISGFNTAKAMKIVNDKDLLSGWTDTRVGEMQHRTFVLELGKEPLLP